jgi:hypothetical protein
MGKTAFTDFLVPTSGFLTGAGSVIAVGGDYYFYNTCLIVRPKLTDVLCVTMLPSSPKTFPS